MLSKCDDDDDTTFSDVSSIDDWDSRIHGNEKSRYPGRLKMAQKQKQQEEEARARLEAAVRRQKEEEERLLAAVDAKANANPDASDDDSGSGFSDLGDDDQIVQETATVEQEGPDTDKLSEASDEEIPATQRRNSYGSTDTFGSESDTSIVEERPSPTVFTRSDDANRVKIMIQVSASASPQSVVVRLRPDWAPLGAARFFELVENDFFRNVRFHRVLKGQLAQFGLPVDPSLYQTWGPRVLEDDPVVRSNSRGTLSFASRGPGTRNCQVFMNLRNNKPLDSQGFAPFAEIVQGMDVIDDIYDGYGDIPPKGSGPNPDLIKQSGLAYLQEWPKLSLIQYIEVLSRTGSLELRTSLKPPSISNLDDMSESPRKDQKKVSFSKPIDFQDSETATTVTKPSSPERAESPAGSGLAAIRSLKD